MVQVRFFDFHVYFLPEGAQLSQRKYEPQQECPSTCPTGHVRPPTSIEPLVPEHAWEGPEVGEFGIQHGIDGRRERNHEEHDVTFDALTPQVLTPSTTAP